MESFLQTMHSVILLLGGNLGDVSLTFFQVRQTLEKEIGTIQQQSSLYSSASWGYNSSSIYLNQAIEIKTSFSPEVLLEKVLDIEKRFGRHRDCEEGYHDRQIDIDILLFDDDCINTEKLVIPHPRMHVRNFVLIPLIEIVPNRQHPVFDKTMEELLSETKDIIVVNKIDRV